MRKLKLKFLWKNLELLLDEQIYETWNKYLWLYEKNWEFFSDISVNFDWIGSTEIAISKDFENCCFENSEQLYQRIKKNFDIKSRWIHNWYFCFNL